MRICDLCHGREFVFPYFFSIWRVDETPSSETWDLCEECRLRVKAEIQAVLHTKLGKATAPAPAAKKRPKQRQGSNYV